MDELQDQERAKYERVWTYEGYRRQADGDPVVMQAYEAMGCKPGESLIDWGCGKGTPAQAFQDKGLVVTGIDIARNCLDPDVKINLYVACLWDVDIGLEADYAFCTDVLEHIPPERLPAVLDTIASRTRKAAFIQVCTTHDTFGRKMDPPETLHLSVMPYVAWDTLLRARWPKVSGSLRGKSRAYFLCMR